MRRIVTAVASALALALALPGVALAHHHARGARHHGRHGSRHHRARGARVIRFTTSAEGEGAKASTQEPTTEAIGTVASFEGEVLKIKLNDGSEVGGKVTADTRLLCVSSTPAPGADEDQVGDEQSAEGDQQSSEGDQSSGGDEGSSDDGEGDEGETQDHSSLPSAHDSSFDDGEESGDDDGQAAVQSCETSALIPGAKVREAELRISSSGPMWESVVLIS